MPSALAWAAALSTFLVVDAAWLILFAAQLFKAQVGSLIRDQPNLAAAAVFYLVYSAGMLMLVVQPALRERSVRAAGWRGALLGLTAYATFDLTNLAVVAGWTLTVALVDMAWGTLATAVACMAGYWAGYAASRLGAEAPTTAADR